MKTYIIMIVLQLLVLGTDAQTLYVDASTGNDAFLGDKTRPLKSIQKAVDIANAYTGLGSVTIKVNPGMYLLVDKLIINPVKLLNDTSRYQIEAVIMPDDPEWTPEKMPVIQSISPNNSKTQFPHATGILVASSHVSIRGVKFLGNGNPEVTYYYPISRENPELFDLEVAQCFFIGERYSSIIQGGIWAHGKRLNMHHNVFYYCKNAILVFKNISSCNITHNIIIGAYESALWVGENTSDFNFSHNVIARSSFVWTKSYEGNQTYTLKNSLFVDNENFVGQWDRKLNGLVPLKTIHLREKNMIKRGKVTFVQRNQAMLPSRYLHLQPSSPGYNLKAGVFIK